MTTENCIGKQSEYWRLVALSEGFDLENISLSSNSHIDATVTGFGLMPFDCEGCKRYPYKILVNLYAKVGLHRYNMLEGTSFQLDRLLKFNMLSNCVSSFYMTLLADDRDSAASTLQKTFHVRVDEKIYGSLDLGCSIARPRDEVTTKKKPFIPHGGPSEVGTYDEYLAWYLGLYDDPYKIFKGELPDWPSDDDLNDGKRFYVVKESERQATDWILMYLELVIVANDRSITEFEQQTHRLSELKVVKVAIETATDDVEPLKARCANVYITFKGMEEIRNSRWVYEIGKDIERKAIVRRVMNEYTGYFSLAGKLCGGQYVKPFTVALQNGEKPEGWKKQKRKKPRVG